MATANIVETTTRTPAAVILMTCKGQEFVLKCEVDATGTVVGGDRMFRWAVRQRRSAATTLDWVNKSVGAILKIQGRKLDDTDMSHLFNQLRSRYLGQAKPDAPQTKKEQAMTQAERTQPTAEERLAKAKIIFREQRSEIEALTAGITANARIAQVLLDLVDTIDTCRNMKQVHALIAEYREANTITVEADDDDDLFAEEEAEAPAKS